MRHLALCGHARTVRCMYDDAPPASQFLHELDVRSLPNGRTWMLLSRFGYDVGHLGSGDTIEVPAGFLTDFASVPWMFRWFAQSTGPHGRAAILHDWLYWRQERSRWEADRIFLEAMKVAGVAWWRRWPMWAAVRVGGWWAWRANRGLTAADKLLNPTAAPRMPGVEATHTVAAVS